MKKYTAPELSIVTFNLSDVITSSIVPDFVSNIGGGGIEDVRTSLKDFETTSN